MATRVRRMRIMGRRRRRRRGKKKRRRRMKIEEGMKEER